MTNYDDFLEDLKAEYDNVNIKLNANTVINKYQKRKIVKNPFRFKLGPWIGYAALACMLFVMFNLSIIRKSSTDVRNTYAAYTSVLANFVATSDEELLQLNSVSDESYLDIVDTINHYILSINNALSSSKTNNEEIELDDNLYSYKMETNFITSQGINITYCMYYNKTRENKKGYDMEGVIPIKNHNYNVKGTYDETNDLVSLELTRPSGSNLCIKQRSKTNFKNCEFEEIDENNINQLASIKFMDNEIIFNLGNNCSFKAMKINDDLIFDVLSNSYKGLIEARIISVTKAEYVLIERQNEKIIKKVI